MTHFVSIVTHQISLFLILCYIREFAFCKVYSFSHRDFYSTNRPIMKNSKKSVHMQSVSLIYGVTMQNQNGVFRNTVAYRDFSLNCFLAFVVLFLKSYQNFSTLLTISLKVRDLWTVHCVNEVLLLQILCPPLYDNDLQEQTIVFRDFKMFCVFSSTVSIESKLYQSLDNHRPYGIVYINNNLAFVFRRSRGKKN